MKKYRLLAGFLALMVLAAGCGQTERKETGEILERPVKRQQLIRKDPQNRQMR